MIAVSHYTNHIDQMLVSQGMFLSTEARKRLHTWLELLAAGVVEDCKDHVRAELRGWDGCRSRPVVADFSEDLLKRFQGYFNNLLVAPGPHEPQP